MLRNQDDDLMWRCRARGGIHVYARIYEFYSPDPPSRGPGAGVLGTHARVVAVAGTVLYIQYVRTLKKIV